MSFNLNVFPAPVFNPVRFPHDPVMQTAFESMLVGTQTIHHAAEAKMEWLQRQTAAAVLIKAFVSECLASKRRYGISVSMINRVNKVLELPPETSLDDLAASALRIVKVLAYKHECAYERMLESPDEPCISTKEWFAPFDTK